MGSPPIAVVAVPAKDEADRIAGCLQALALQGECRPDRIVLVINNSGDATAAIVRALMPLVPVPVTVIEHRFAPEVASAGSARRMAMERAAAGLHADDVLLTTDADGRVPADWVAANMWHIRNGADAVAGRAVLEPAEAALIPAALHANDALECAYGRALDEVASLLDPDAADPWPRHTEHSGASIAVRVGTYRQVGGMPAAPLAEDRRFFAALRRIDARVRHAPEIAVVVSGRTVGRAEGGMADTIRRRLGAPDPYLDDALEPVAMAALRARLRARFRRVWAGEGDGARLAAALAVPASAVTAACRAAFAGEGWAGLEAASPVLVRRLVPAREVLDHLAEAEQALRMLAPATEPAG